MAALANDVVVTLRPELARRIAEIKRSADTYAQRIETANTVVAEDKLTEQIMRGVLNELTSKRPNKMVRDAVPDSKDRARLVRRTTEHIERLVVHRREQEHSVSVYAGHLANYKRQLESAERTMHAGKNTRTVAEIIADVETNKHVRPRRTTIEQSDSGICTLQWFYDGLIMYPSHNPHRFITSTRPDGKVGILLPRVRVRHKIGSTSVFLFSAPGQPRFNGYTSECVHPHIMNSDGYPCLGDFADSIVNAASSGQFGFLADAVAEFLGQANNGDGAGAQWPNWLDHGTDVKRYMYDRVVQGKDGKWYIELPTGGLRRYEVDETGKVTIIHVLK